MDTNEKEKRLKDMIDVMTEDKLKEMCFESFVDGLEKGMKIQDLKTKEEEKETA